MAKNNIRSIRFSDELADLIDHQIGDTFTQKFESLIYRAFWELPEKEKELAEINQRIQDQWKRLAAIQTTIEELNNIGRSIHTIEANIIHIRQQTLTLAQKVKKAETQHNKPT